MRTMSVSEYGTQVPFDTLFYVLYKKEGEKCIKIAYQVVDYAMIHFTPFLFLALIPFIKLWRLTMICNVELTNGIKNIMIRCGCTIYEVCLDFQSKPIINKDTIEICGTKSDLETVTGYELTMKSTAPLDLEFEESCYKEVDIYVESRKGPNKYAVFTNGLMSYVGHEVSGGVWMHNYKVIARNSELVQELPSAPMTLEFESCLYSFDSECVIDSLVFDVFDPNDPDTAIAQVSLINGELRDQNGILYGTLDGFSLPIDSFTIAGTFTSDGGVSSFELGSSEDCPKITLTANGSGVIQVDTLTPTSEYDVTIYDYITGTNSTTTYTGSNIINVSNAGNVSIVGCGVDSLHITGNFGVLDLGDSCVSSIDLFASTITEVNGEGHFLTQYLGNGVVEPSCEWPLLDYGDRGLSGVVDLSCWVGLMRADIQSGDITGIIPNPTVTDLQIQNNPQLTHATANICGFPSLQFLQCNNCNFDSFDFDCVPTLEILRIYSNPLTTLIHTAPTNVVELVMSNTSNTTANFIALGTNFPLLEVLFWDYTGTSDILIPAQWPNIRVFVAGESTGDPNPFFWTTSPTVWSNLEIFTYERAPVVSTDLNLILSSLVNGGAQNAVINLAFLNPPPDALGCSRIATLQSNGCTVNYTAGGPC